MPDPTVTIVVTQRVEEPPLRQALWRIYADSFASSDDSCAQDQICYDPRTLEEALVDPDYWKFLVFCDGDPIGLSLMTNNLAKARIAYCNDRFLRKKYPEFTSAGKLYYVTAICVTPAMQGGPGLQLMARIVSFLEDRQAAVAFDFSENKNAALPDAIAYAGRKLLGISIRREDLDRQVYTVLFGERRPPPG